MNSISLFNAKYLKIFAELLVLVLFFGCQKEISAPETGEGSDATLLKSAKITNLLVITKSETLPEGLEAKLSAYGEIVRSIPEIGEMVIKPNSSGAAKQIAALSEVKAAVTDISPKWIDPVKPETELGAQSIGDDEKYFKYQWGMKAIHAPEAWDAGYTGQGARVFILDSGIDADNPDLQPNLNTELSKSFVDGEDYNVREGNFFNHGSHVAGIIAAADNNWGVIGVAPHAEIVAVKVLSEYTGSGSFSQVNAGIVYAANNGADVINMSLGATINRNGNYLDDDDVWQQAPAAEVQFLILAQQRAINYAMKKGAVVIVSAGNNGINADGDASLFILPADLQNVLAVSATAPYGWAVNPGGSLDIPASYTNFGKSLVAVAAPGGDFDYPTSAYVYDMVISCCTGGSATGYSFYFASGTSQAAPHVAGVAALIIGKNGGSMSPAAVTQKLLKTADKIDGNGSTAYYGKGRVNAYRAVTE